jgi:AraC-like DNA-binding protein
MVDKEYFETQLRQYSAGDAPALRGDVFPSNERLLASLREFMSEYEDRALGYESLLTSAGLKIAHLIIRQILGIETKDEKVDFRMATNHAVEFMHTHLSEKLTLADLARTARLSPSQFSRVFKAETGTAPIEYLQELRLFRARRLLRDTIRPVTDIALECGFNSSSYLSRCFQSRWGLSPSKFRKTAHMRG